MKSDFTHFVTVEAVWVFDYCTGSPEVYHSFCFVESEAKFDLDTEFSYCRLLVPVMCARDSIQ